MEANTLFREMPLTCLITNYAATGGFERIYLATGRKPGPSAENEIRKKPENETRRHTWNGRPMRI
jgi:hypothetical protein